LAIANICSDVMEFFMVSLQIRDESLSPFLKNIDDTTNIHLG
jgi:hypothetical protein